MTSRAFLLLGFLIVLLVSVSSASAETVPSTLNEEIVSDLKKSWSLNGGSLFISPRLAADDWLSTRPTYTEQNLVEQTPGYVWVLVVENSGATYYIYIDGGDTCVTGSSWNGSDCVTATYSCPSGYAMSADQLSCTKADCPAGVLATKGVYFGQTITSPACINGCVASYSGQQPWDSASGWIYIGQYTNTGQTCSESTVPPPSDVPAPTPPESTDPPTTTEYDCVSQGMSYGQVNGVTVCVPSGTPGTPPMIEPPQTETETNPDGTKVETQTQDSQNGPNITRQTTTIVRDAQGNIVSQATTSTTASESAFCEQNPNAAICAKSKTSGGGSCETPPASEGDAIQAAILKQAWETRCESKKTNTALGEGSQLAQELAGVGEGAMNGDPTDLSELTDEIDVAGQISTSKFLSGGCIPDKVITGLPMGKTVTIPFSNLCSYLEIFGNIMVIVSMLAAARIVGVF